MSDLRFAKCVSYNCPQRNTCFRFLCTGNGEKYRYENYYKFIDSYEKCIYYINQKEIENNMKTNPLMDECRKRITPEIKEQVERICNIMDECHKIYTREYSLQYGVSEKVFTIGFQEAVNYIKESNVLPIYIVSKRISGMPMILFVSTNENDAIEFYNKQDFDFEVTIVLSQCIKNEETVLKIKTK